MHTSEQGRAFLAAHEGVVLRAYRDVAGVWTIGVGHTARAGPPAPQPGMTLTRDEALALLARDLARFEARVTATRAFTAQPAFDGAVSFDFNTGRIHNASWVAHYRRGRYVRAEASLMQWVKAGGRTWPGLVRRRAAEADLIFRGRYDAGETSLSRRDEIRAYQTSLKTLGFYAGAVDGIAGPATRAAVRAFQRAHPHLAEDGIVGPATRAALQRAINAVRRPLQTGGAAAGAAAAATADQFAGPAAAPAGLDGLSAGLWLAAAALLVAAGFFAWRYRDEIRLFANRL